MTQNLCQCGCGEPVVFYKYKTRRFIKGHQARGKNNSNWGGGKCNPTKWYKKTWMPDHPYSSSNYVYNHRLVMEKHIGRYLFPEELVHHIDKDIHNNNISNLELVDRSKHQNIHHPIQDRSIRFCKYCNGKTYTNAKGKEMWSGNEKDGWICRKCLNRLCYKKTKNLSMTE